MSKYHINKATGEVGPCRAVNSCPFGDLTDDHYKSQDDAREAYEIHMNEETISTLTKKNQELKNRSSKPDLNDQDRINRIQILAKGYEDRRMSIGENSYVRTGVSSPEIWEASRGSRFPEGVKDIHIRVRNGKAQLRGFDSDLKSTVIYEKQVSSDGGFSSGEEAALFIEDAESSRLAYIEDNKKVD